MILSELRDYLKTAKIANLMTLSKHLQADPEVIRDMLSVWIHKGKVRKCSQVSGCGTKCTKCNPLLTEFYQWIGNNKTPHPEKNLYVCN